MFNQQNYVTYTEIIKSSIGHFLINLKNQTSKPILYVVDSEKEINDIEKQIKYFNPEIEVIKFFGYDCLPYDRASPSCKTISSRIDALDKILSSSNKNIIILATISAIIQKVIPKNILCNLSKTIKIKDKVNRDELFSLLIKNGYIRTEIANDAGYFAVRGSIVDIFDARQNVGYRLDFFGDIVENIKEYDGITQISSKKLEQINLLPASEVIFTDEYIDNFKANYKKLFNTSAVNDLLYENIANKRKLQAIEHWLPLFYNKLESIFDYLSSSTIIIFGNNSEENYNSNIKSIQDYFNARELALNDKYSRGDFKYYPTPIELMWLSNDEFQKTLRNFNIAKITQYSEDKNHIIQTNYSAVPNFFVKSKIESKPVFELLKEYRSSINKKLIISANSEGSLERLKNLLQVNNIHFFVVNNWNEYKNISGKTIGITLLSLEKGFSSSDFTIISEQDLFGEKNTRIIKSTKKLENLLNEAASLNKGELVVHSSHGIGKFEGLQTLEVEGIKHDFLLLIYADNDKLFLPVENIELISRYSEDENVKLDKLGNSNWQERKAKIKNRIKDIAKDLIKIAAERELQEAQIIIPNAQLYDEFCARFPYVETEDQLRAIEDVRNDFMSGKPSDRLICGDVGFGKTEIALRAAFIATHCEDHSKMQVAVIVPTTLLATQHYENFSQRFAGFGVKIKMLSRLITNKEATIIKQEIASGDVDIVIGTHALLSKDIKFNNLQLLIIDEEQHFGVSQKEQLKKIRANIHVLTLSATPIPRTMQMSFVGIKDLSLIATPPIDRMVIKTFIMPFDKIVVREAILREYYRGGKCFYVSPRITDLHEIKKDLDILVPEVKSVIAHGQMTPLELDNIMHDFSQGKFDILISTTIVESGLDIPLANTIFINKADFFGLSALYQLRGRVGRSNISAFAYLLLPNNKKISKIANKRLEVMQTLDSLGAGFSVASHDMDIRGFGNLLGEEQSGQIKEVGAELYQSMLKDSIEELRNADLKLSENSSWSPQINLGFSVLIPEFYIPEIHLRMGLYRRIASLTNETEIEDFKQELVDRFGKYPIDVEQLLITVKIKILCKELNIEKIDAGSKGVVVTFRNNIFSNPENLLNLIVKHTHIKMKPDGKLVFIRNNEILENRINYVFEILATLNNLVDKK